MVLPSTGCGWLPLTTPANENCKTIQEIFLELGEKEKSQMEVRGAQEVEVEIKHCHSEILLGHLGKGELG